MKINKQTIGQPLGFKVWKDFIHKMKFFHSHSDIEINFLLNGWAKYVHGGKVYEIKPFEFAIFWGGIPHSAVEISEKSETIWVTLPIEWVMLWYIKGPLIEKLLAGEMIIQPIEKSKMEFEKNMILNWVKEFESGKAEYIKNIQLELEVKMRRINQWMESSKYKNSSSSIMIHKSFNSIIELISNDYLSIRNTDELAHKLNLHPKYLTQMFKRHTGINIWDYIIHLRLAHAQRLLITTKNKIIDICFESGFQTTSNFYHIFKKYNHNISPAVYRKRIQG